MLGSLIYILTFTLFAVLIGALLRLVIRFLFLEKKDQENDGWELPIITFGILILFWQFFSGVPEVVIDYQNLTQNKAFTLVSYWEVFQFSSLIIGLGIILCFTLLGIGLSFASLLIARPKKIVSESNLQAALFLLTVFTLIGAFVAPYYISWAESLLPYPEIPTFNG